MKFQTTRSRLALVNLMALLVFAGCGGGGSSSEPDPVGAAPSPAPAPSPSPAPAPTPSPAPAAAGAISVGWNANTDADLAGYKVYVGTAAGAYTQARGAGLNAGLATDYVVTGLQLNSTYYIAVTSYDKSGNESNYSTPVAGVAK